MSEAIALTAAFLASFVIAQAAAWILLWAVVTLIQTAGDRHRRSKVPALPAERVPAAADPEKPLETLPSPGGDGVLASAPEADLEAAGEHLN